MLRERIKKDIEKAVSGIGYQVSGIDIEVTRVQDPGFGDYSTNIALRLTPFAQGKPPATQTVKPFGKPQDKQTPMESARLLSSSLQNLPYIKKLEVKEPGFINFFIKEEYWQNQVDVVLKAGVKYGSNSQ